MILNCNDGDCRQVYPFSSIRPSVDLPEPLAPITAVTPDFTVTWQGLSTDSPI